MGQTLAAMLAMAAVATLSHAQTRTAPRSPTPAPAPAPAPARTEMAVPFRVGETLTFDVAYSTYLVAGTATSSVVEKRSSDGSPAYYIVAEGRPLPLIARIYALYYKMDTLLDSVTGLSQRSTLYTEEGSRHRTATTRFDRRSRKAQFELQADGTATDEFAIPLDVQDGLATLYALRTRTFRAGERLTIPIADDGTLYSAQIDPVGPSHVKMRLGEFEAWTLRITVTDPKGEAVGKNIEAVITADPRRLPLKLQADLPVGSFALALRDVK